MVVVKLLVLLIVANGVPQLVRTLIGARFNFPVDCALVLKDQHRLFGASKTWRGIVAAMIFTPFAAWLLAMSWQVGLLVAAGAMAGDLLSSFIKRRLGKEASAKVTILDQVPEAVIPMSIVYLVGDYHWLPVCVAAMLFVLLDIVMSPLLFRWGVRQVPH